MDTYYTYPYNRRKPSSYKHIYEYEKKKKKKTRAMFKIHENST